MVLQEAEARGEDYDRVKLLEVGADDAEKWERKKKKKSADPGFSGNIETDIYMDLIYIFSAHIVFLLNTLK